MNRRKPDVRTWIAASLALVLAALGLVAFSRRMATVEPVLGVRWVQSSAGPLALNVEPGGPADRAGLREGDVLRRLDGSPVESALDAASLPWNDREGPLRLEVLRGNATRTVEIRPVGRRGAPSLYAFLSLVGAAFLVSGAFVAIRLPTVRGGTTYAALGGAVFVMATFSHTGRADGLDWFVFWADVVSGALVPALLVHLVLDVSRRGLPGRRIGRVLVYVPSAALVLGATWLLAGRGAYRFSDPTVAVQSIDRLQGMFLAAATVASVAALALAQRRTRSSLQRTQLRWMLWGLSIGIGPFAAIYALPWALEGAVPGWADLSVLSLLVVPAALTASLARYRLHDLDLVLRRGLAATTLGFFTIGTYAASLVLLRRLAGDLRLPESVLGFLAALVTAVAYPRLRSWVRVGVDRAFYRARYSYRATLLDWGRELSAEMDLPSLLDLLEDRVRRTLGVSSARVLVQGADGRFRLGGHDGDPAPVRLDTDLVEALGRGPYVAVEEGRLSELPWARFLFAMKVKGRLCAVLATADRADREEPLSSEDRALLTTLSAHAATAIEAARLFREAVSHGAQVERLKARQERILESSGVGLLLLDAKGRIQAWNRPLEEIYGLERDDAIGRTMSEVFPLQTVRRIERELASLPPGEEVRIYRHALINRNGLRLLVNLSVSPAADDHGGDGARVVTIDDVTERIRLEEQVLRQERLASLGLLAAGVAHEVNTPLTGISSYTQLLLEELPDDDRRRPLLEKIETQSQRASSIANSLLNLARPERSAFEALDLNDTVEEVLGLFAPQVRHRRVEIHADLEPGLPEVRGHKGKLQQVVVNLLLNARDAVGEQGSIGLSTRQESGRVVLEVTDDGAGIAEDDLPRIFDPFFTTKGRGKGTGLGLSISYGIVREHDGEMHVESTPGERTRFRVELPVYRRAEAYA